MYLRIMFSIAVGIPGTFQGTEADSGSALGNHMTLTVCFPTTPRLGQVLQYGLCFVLLDGFGHHVKDIMHYGCTELKIIMRFHTLFCNRLCNALAVSSLKLTSKQIAQPVNVSVATYAIQEDWTNHLSRSGTIPRMKNNQTRQPGAQNPHPGPFPTGPVLKR
jgi:hypothetical protein